MLEDLYVYMYLHVCNYRQTWLITLTDLAQMKSMTEWTWSSTTSDQWLKSLNWTVPCW